MLACLAHHLSAPFVMRSFPQRVTARPVLEWNPPCLCPLVAAMISTQYLSRISLQREKVESFDRYPFHLPAIRTFDSIVPHPKVTFLIGENGSGKSTLLEAIAVSLGFNPEGGTKNFKFGTRASHSNLADYLRIARGVRRPKDGFFLRAESFFNVATEIE